VQDSKFFQMFDVDGDGLISYTEYLLLITFLSIPVEVSNADCMLDQQRFIFSYTEHLLLITFLSIPVEVSNADCIHP